MSAPASIAAHALRVRRLGRVAYTETWHAMRGFTDARGPTTADELWVLEHPPVYTLGWNARAAHVLDPGGIPVVRCDRGGQVTYHGPGQLVLYTLVDLRRRRLGVRAFVHLLEQAVLDLLAGYGIRGERRAGAPGVYVGGAKLAALGLRLRRGAAYHGLSLNVAMDLAPFRRIDPCGFAGLPVTQLRDLGVPDDPARVAATLLAALDTALRTPESDRLPSASPPTS